MISVFKIDFVMNQGSLFRHSFIITDSGVVKDLSGYTARMQVRAYKDSTTVLLDANTTNNRMSINGPQGLVTVNVSGLVSDGLSFGDAWYDIEIVDPGGEPTRIVEGRISLNRQVTR